MRPAAYPMSALERELTEKVSLLEAQVRALRDAASSAQLLIGLVGELSGAEGRMLDRAGQLLRDGLNPPVEAPRAAA